MRAIEAWSLVVPVIALAIPVTLTLTGVASPRRAPLASGAALVLSVLLTVAALVSRGAAAPGSAVLGVRVDAVTCVMLLLVATLGAIVSRYSRTYLHGDPGLVRYERWFLITLSAVTALVIANNLLFVALGWTATSLGLHQLLTFYSDRAAALVAAHKKFFISRVADVCLLISLALVQNDVGSLDLDRIADWAGLHPALTPSMRVAAMLVVMAVVLKSAQLPFHGWLTQVMEAPTPVSALLHAGVVNIGGFVLIRLAPLMARAELAQLLLVVVGLVSSVLAALVMTTRISIKVALAWSTCAQMGFMLVQCGLGLWHLALLHLVAHSLYKAHAFLSAGTTVDDWRRRASTKPPPPPSWARLGLGLLMALASAALCVIVLRRGAALSMSGDRSVPLLAMVVGFSLVPLLAAKAPRLLGTADVALYACGVVLLYVGWHAAAARLMPFHVETSNPLSWVLVGLGFAGLFAVKTMLEMFPNGTLARVLYPWLFAGLYLDERFTRLTFRVWPPRLPRASESQRAIDIRDSLEARA